ncbi:MAG: L,D-transpeptidase family protein, partial [Pseudomonadota bacterium]
MNYLTILKTKTITSKTLAVLYAAASAIVIVQVAPVPAIAKSANQSKIPKTRQSLKSELPMTIVISLAKQRLVAYRGTEVVARSRISSGKRGHRTPKGVFTILQKRKRHYSNLYAGAPMPFMQRVTWSGIALHAGHLPGYPASHGCIRLPYSFAKKLFSMTSMADRVIVTDGGPTPRKIAHDALITPLPLGDETEVAALASATAGSAAETDTQRDANAPQWLMGVSTAHAAAVNGDLEAQIKGPVTRTSVATARLNQLNRLEKMSADTKKWANEAAETLKAANLKLRKLNKAPARHKIEISELRREVRKLHREKHGIEREMRDFILSARHSEPASEPAPSIAIASVPKPRLIHNASIKAAEAATAIASRDEEQTPAAGLDLAALEAEMEQRLTAKHDEIDAIMAKMNELSRALAVHEETMAAEKLRRDILKQRHTTAAKHHLRITQDLKKAKRAQERYEKPITVLISRKKQKLYVRQDQDEILEAPVTFENPDSPIGTHVFTATGYTADQEDLHWKTITPARGAAKVKRTKGMSRKAWRARQAQAKKAAGT